MRTTHFDGFGVNGMDEYRSRLATLTEEGQRMDVGPLFAAAHLMHHALTKFLYDNPNCLYKTGTPCNECAVCIGKQAMENIRLGTKANAD